jgi:hypothetical protein
MKIRIPIAATVAAVMAVSSFGINTALAAPPHATPPSLQNDAQVIQVASKKKHRRVHRGNAAAAGAVIGLFGAIAGMAAQDAYRDRYYDDGYYYGGPGPVYNYAPRYHHRGYYGHPGYNRVPDGTYRPNANDR